MKKVHPSIYISKICKRLGKPGVKMWYYLHFWMTRRRWPSFKHPKDLSERILSSMLSEDFLRYADLADKVKAPEYVKSKGLEKILLKHYGVWKRADDINLEALPNKFILKPNNGSGGHVICRDKSSFDFDAAKRILQSNLDRGCHYAYEPHYNLIEPRILCEELLDLGEGRVLTDYKFTCVKGKIADIFLAGENSKGERKYATVDLNWNPLPYTLDSFLLTPLPPKPEKLDEMVEYAKILSEDFDFVRVDLYEHEGKVYFSELTFSPWGGFMYSYNDYGLKTIGKMFEE
jgi:hypothetical protein